MRNAGARLLLARYSIPDQKAECVRGSARLVHERKGLQLNHVWRFLYAAT